ncbi:MAG: tyrosine-type recombinase/integrase [Anaerolineae bacterium]
MADPQMPLFPQKGRKGQYGPPVAQLEKITDGSSLAAAAGAFYDHMLREGFSEHTVKAFSGDLRLLQKYLGPSLKLSEIGTKELNDFLTWLLHYRGVPCSPKTYARRVTTLKSFFGWLTATKVIPLDPAAAVVHHRVTTPLPQFLHDEQVDRLLETTENLLSEDKPDARPHLLASLLLQTGIKKAECMRLALRDIDRSNPRQPTILIRYTNPRLHHKERKLGFASDLLPVLDQYLAAYQPGQNVFECTPRNLEYVLADVAERAQLTDGVSFEMLRWTCAVRDYRDGMASDKLRQKLGLSEVTWRETEAKLAKLSSPGL